MKLATQNLEEKSYKGNSHCLHHLHLLWCDICCEVDVHLLIIVVILFLSPALPSVPPVWCPASAPVRLVL